MLALVQMPGNVVGVDTAWGPVGWRETWGSLLVSGVWAAVLTATLGPAHLSVEDHFWDLAVLHRRPIVVPCCVAEGEARLGPRRGRLMGHLAQAFGAVVGVWALWGWGHNVIRTTRDQDPNWVEGSRTPAKGVCCGEPQVADPPHPQQMAILSLPHTIAGE